MYTVDVTITFLQLTSKIVQAVLLLTLKVFDSTLGQDIQ